MTENENQENALTEYIDSCNDHFVAVFFAVEGLELRRNKFKMALKASPLLNPNYFVSRRRPGKGVPYAACIKLRSAISNSSKDGPYSDMLYKSILVLMYAEWEEYYRELIGQQIGASRKEHVQCVFVGELRYIRNWIVHRRSVPDKNVTKIQHIPWSFVQGQRFSITSSMLQDFMEILNSRLLVFNSHEKSDRELLVNSNKLLKS